VMAGERVTYTILLSNTGSLSANVHYTDTLPTELEWLNGIIENGAVTVDAGKSVTRLILAQVKTQVGNSTVFYNTVGIDDGYHSILTRRSPPTAVSAFPSICHSWCIARTRLAPAPSRMLYKRKPPVMYPLTLRIKLCAELPEY